MSECDIHAAVLTSKHSIAYYSGTLWNDVAPPAAFVVTRTHATTVCADVDGGRAARRSCGDNLIYSDLRRDSFWRAIRALTGRHMRLGFEGDHLTVLARENLTNALEPVDLVDISLDCMRQRMIKSPEEIALIHEGARIAGLGGEAIRAEIRPGVREIDVAMAGRDAMEREIARVFPDSELGDSWVWFQSAINTDGAHNPATTRKLQPGDLLVLNAFPVVSGYHAAVERTLFLGEPDQETLRIWQANVDAHRLGLSMLKPGNRCSDVLAAITTLLAERNLLKYRRFGNRHSFGLLSHCWGRETSPEQRGEIDMTVQKDMVVSMEPMLTIPQGRPGAGGYRERDVILIQARKGKALTTFPCGPEHNIIAV